MPQDVFVISVSCVIIFVILIGVILIIVFTSGNNKNNSNVVVISPRAKEQKTVKIQEKTILVAPIKIELPIKIEKKLEESPLYTAPSPIGEILFDDFSSPIIKKNIICDDYSEWSESTSWTRTPFTDKPAILSEDSNIYVAESSDIIDVVVYADKIHYLYNNNIIRVGNKKFRLKINGTRALIGSIVVFRGYLIGLAGGSLYYLNKQHGSRWSFRPLDISNFNEVVNINDNIIRIGTTLECEYLSVQTERYLYLYDNKGSLLSRTEYLCTHKRVYGNRPSIYVDINIVKHIAKLSTSKYRYTSVIDAAVSHSGELIPITYERSKEYNYISVRIIENIPYFLIK